MNNWAKNVNNIDLLLELYHRTQRGEIIIKGRKWEKSGWEKYSKKQVCLITDKDKKVFLISHKVEGTKLYTNYNEEYSHLL